jgi:pimeloyl-ACP methyl ester carboxylesterase
VLYQREQAEACWRAIEAPLLFVIADQSDLMKRMSDEINEIRLREIFRRGTLATVKEAGHMMHHERPAELAALIEQFLEGDLAERGR